MGTYRVRLGINANYGNAGMLGWQVWRGNSQINVIRGTFCGFWHLRDCLTSRTLTLLGCLVDAQQGHSISCRRISHLTKLEMIIIIMLRSSILLWELRGASKEGEEGAGTGGGVAARRRYSMSPAGVKGRLSVLMHTCLLTLHGSIQRNICVCQVPLHLKISCFICRVPILATVLRALCLNAKLPYTN